MDWEDVCKQPELQDLPYKIELNEYGQIVMTPVSLEHSYYQSRILLLLERLLANGKALPECAIKTGKGTRSADVAWISDQRLGQLSGQFQCITAPEICVEVRSPSNRRDELDEKRHLYIAAGAQEVWYCLDGQMEFYDADGRLPRSRRAPDFPHSIVKDF